ncbi:MAG: chemotaxis protein CheR [Bosea sp.]|jgi:chemotaxis protein methyltransferase CheR|nr:chemotaxis protein CheR [Bosea sp. (in: a-proteobacteria)]
MLALANADMSGAAPVDLTLRQDELRLIAQIVHEKSGIVIRDNKSAMTRGRLMRRVKALGLSSISDYIALLRTPERDRELPGLLNALTTNHTSFFRERHHFDQLASEVLPTILARKPARLRIWSSACSSGEEPYSIAAILHRALRGHTGCDARILATDLDTEILERARAAEYAEEAVSRAPPDLAPLLGCAPSSRAGHLTVGEPLRRLVTCRQLNLLEPWPFNGPFDVIFCRNVMIYFDTPTKMALIDRFAGMLAPHGTLFIGHSESLGPNYNQLKLVGRTAYSLIGRSHA